VMKHSAALTDVQKAEQRAWENEQEAAKLKDQLTRAKLDIQRAEFRHGQSVNLESDSQCENESPKEASFFSTHEAERSPLTTMGSPGVPSAAGSPAIGHSSPGLLAGRTVIGYSSPDIKRSPGIDRAMRQKVRQENILRNTLLSMSSTRASPERSPAGTQARLLLDTSSPTRQMSMGKVLSPTRKHEQAANQYQESPNAKMASNVYGLGGSKSASQLQNTEEKHQPTTLLDRMGIDDVVRPECQQS
jgi:hypothetical protein